MRRKLQQSLLNNNPFPSLRNNEETFFSLQWHKENNISDLCCLVIQSLYQLGLFSCCKIWTLRAECGSLLSGEFLLFPFLFVLTVRPFMRRIKKKTKTHALEDKPVPELMCLLINGKWVCASWGLYRENICWKIPGEGEVLTDSFRVSVPQVLQDSGPWHRS